MIYTKKQLNDLVERTMKWNCAGHFKGLATIDGLRKNRMNLGIRDGAKYILNYMS